MYHVSDTTNNYSTLTKKIRVLIKKKYKLDEKKDQIDIQIGEVAHVLLTTYNKSLREISKDTHYSHQQIYILINKYLALKKGGETT